MRRIFIGYDHRQPISSAVARHSISRRSSVPLAITDLRIETLPLKREGLTPFTFTRYLVPWLCEFEGHALFLDADVLCLADIEELLAAANLDATVSVVRHKQRFEWPSVMLFNNAKCRVLSPDYVENAHNVASLDWAAHIGRLPEEWNHLVGYDEPRPDAKLVHFTQGVPAWPETAETEYADLWRKEARHMSSAASWESLMGRSVHYPHVTERLKRQQEAKQGLAAAE